MITDLNATLAGMLRHSNAAPSQSWRDIPPLVSAMREVLALHTPMEWTHFGEPAQACQECARLGGVNRLTTQWPCPTVQALTGALENFSLNG